jgi:hypothetical protein
MVLGRELRGGVGADERLEAGLDVGHAEGGGEHVISVPGDGAALRLGRDQRRDASEMLGLMTSRRMGRGPAVVQRGAAAWAAAGQEAAAARLR